MPGKDIFLSYRREDAAGWAGRLQESLRRELSGTGVFYDIGSIAIGEDFVDAMRRALPSCGFVVVLIGRRWLDAKDEGGHRRLDDPKDWVRLEVAEGLQRPGLRVVPVLVGAASMPQAGDLPEPVRPPYLLVCTSRTGSPNEPERREAPAGSGCRAEVRRGARGRLPFHRPGSSRCWRSSPAARGPR